MGISRAASSEKPANEAQHKHTTQPRNAHAAVSYARDTCFEREAVVDQRS